MKIAVLETHYKSLTGKTKTGATDYYRSILPITYAGKKLGWDVTVLKGIGEKPSIRDYEKLKAFDFVWLSYMDNSVALKYFIDTNVPYSMDFDDDLINIDPTNPVAQQYADGSNAQKALLWSIIHSPHLTVSTPHLKKSFGHLRKQEITVLKNAIEVGSYTVTKKPHDKIIIGYMGGITHYADIFYSPFWGALNYLIGKYPDKIAFKVFGMIPDLWWKDLPDFRYTSGTSEYTEYRPLLSDWMQDVDIAVAPLHNTYFNKSKSFIKAMEYGVYQVPVVATKITPYEDFNGTTESIQLCDGHKDWVEKLETLINSKEDRELWGKKAVARVNQLSIEKKYTKWGAYIEDIVKNRRIYDLTKPRPQVKRVQFRCLMFGGRTGSELYVYDLAREYLRRGLKVAVLADHYGTDYLDEAKNLGIEIGFNPKADIIHAQQIKPTESVLDKNIPIIQTIHSEILPEYEFPVTHPNIKGYIAVRPTIEAYVMKHTNKPVRTIFNGVDSNLFYKTGEDNGKTLFVGKDDYLRHDTIKALRKRGSLQLVSKASPQTVAKHTRACHQTASIMLGRTTIEGWLCGKPGLVFIVDFNGKIKREQVFEPPADLTPFTIEYMADETLKMYDTCILEDSP